jgi:hypothetical protein
VEVDTEERVRRTRGRRAEWFDVVHDIDTGELIRDLEKEKGGLGVRCDFKDTPVNDDTNAITNDMSVKSLAFLTHPATFNHEEILFYTTLIASLTYLAHNLSLSEMVDWLEDYRHNISTSPPSSSISHLCNALHLPSPPPSYLNLENQPPSAKICEMKVEEDITANPFHPLISYMNKQHARQRAYMPVFIKRYDEAGGFLPTGAEKVGALRVAEGWRRLGERKDDMRQREKTRGEKSGEWLVSVEDGRDLGGEGIGMPKEAWDGDERLEERVLEALRR